MPQDMTLFVQYKPSRCKAWQCPAKVDTLPLWVAGLVNVKTGLSTEIEIGGSVASRKHKAYEGNKRLVQTGDWIIQERDGTFLYDDQECMQRFTIEPTSVGVKSTLAGEKM